jgi:DNA polymerase-2
VPHSQSYEGFILLRQWRDTHEGIVLEIWAATCDLPLHITLSGQEAVMFAKRGTATSASRVKAVALQNLNGEAVDALYFRTQRELVTERDRQRRLGQLPYEADIKPIDRFLMERFVTGSIRVTGTSEERGGVRHFDNPQVKTSDFTPHLKVLSIDIETAGFTGPLLSLALATHEASQVFVVGQGAAAPVDFEDPDVRCYPSETAALQAFIAAVQRIDPDVIIGWNVVDFDLDYLAKLATRLGIPLSLGRGGGNVEILSPKTVNQPTVARIPGRVVLDGIATLRSATLQFESFALQDVARELLGRGKDVAHTDDHAAEIMRMAAEDPNALARYNLEDCRLVLDIFAKVRLIDFAVERQRLTGLPMDKQGGAVAAFDQLYLPRLHRAGYVAPSVGDRGSIPNSPGGYVMNSVPGLYKNVIVLDFKSLYPSIIRTFLVDPLGLAQPGLRPVPGYDGGSFAREGHILPSMISSLWTARDQAKREKNAPMSQAIKIMMNSFYGVLGTPGCRFFDHRLVSSITRRGHEILQRSRAFIEARGLQVIYGDTDSLFVLLDQQLDAAGCNALGAELARALTAYFAVALRQELDIQSHLELQYETHFQRFLMPTMRGSDVGTKKRYAGWVLNTSGKFEVLFKGLEAVRTDWTALARSFQRELFRRVFSDEPYVDYVREVTRRTRAGDCDAELVYTKRIRRPIEEYLRNVPPHVQAARRLKNPGRRISYVVTVSGPEPASAFTSPLDYEHYVTRQLAPAADSLLSCLGTSFDEIAGRQMNLF